MNKELFKIFRGEDIKCQKYNGFWYFWHVGGVPSFINQFGREIAPSDGELYFELEDRCWYHKDANITISGEIFLSPEKGCHVKAEGWDPSENMW